MRTEDVFQLTAEQKAVVELPVAARVLVTAGPGTGKTHTMTARIYHLVSEQNVAAGSEILVLTFTRAAVREIRKRCRGVGGRLDYVLASTFDSFASRLLRKFQPEALQEATSYDARIQAATTLIETNDEARTWLSRYKHIFVDEIQDLVGVRSSFVKVMLHHSNAGFSLFGDPAQSIYNFQLTGLDREIGSKELLQWLVAHFPDLVTQKLTVNHRAQSNLARSALHFGQKLNDERVSHDHVYTSLVSMLDTYEVSVSWEKLGHAIRSVVGKGKIAVLCRTNGECLLVSQYLWEQEIAHVVRRRAEDRYIPKWLALAFRGFSGVSIRATALKERLSRLGLPDPDWVYDSLRRLSDGSRTALRVPELRERLCSGILADELEPEDEQCVVVSTVHRAKGLEFDTVLFLWASPTNQQEFPGEEARVLYVALTRARDKLVRVTSPGFRGLTYDERLDRWLIKYRGWKLRQVEVDVSDLSIQTLPGRLASPPSERMQVQDYIAERVKLGDPVTLVNVDPSGRLPNLTFYVEHNGVVIGTTNEGFSRVLLRAISGRWRPGRIHNLRIAGLRTVVGPPDETSAVGLGDHGFWLAPEISGMGLLSN